MGQQTTPAVAPGGPGNVRPADVVVARLERIPFTRFHLGLAAILGTGTFFDGFDALVIATVLTVVASVFNIGLGSTGLLISAGYVGQFFGAILFGALAERFGRRACFLVALAGFGVLSLVTVFAWSFQSLLVLRLLQGLGLGGEVPLAGALFNESVRGRSRGWVAMAYQSIFSWGTTLVPLIGVLFFHAFGSDLGWRLMFVFGGIPLIVAAIGFFVLPESTRWLADHGRIDEANSILDRMEQSAERGGQKLPPPEVRAQADVKPTRLRELLSREYAKRTIMIWAFWFFGFFVLYGFSTWVPSLYVRLGGLPAQNALLLSAIASFIYLAEVYAFALTTDRVGRRPWFIASFSLAVIGGIYGVLAVAVFHATGWPVLFIGALLLGLGITPPTAGAYMYTAEIYPTRMRAWGIGFGSAVCRIASTIAPTLVGALLATSLGLGSVFAMFGVAAALGLIAIATIGIETRRRVLEELSS